MGGVNNRRHPRVHEKKQLEHSHEDENSISLSAVSALGILAFIFVKGIFWGYILRKSAE